MKIALPTLISVVALAGIASTAPAGTMEGHSIVPPQEIKWGPAPTVLPPGAEAAVLFGDPSKDGLFVLRLKLPEGYRVPPHTHPVDEVITVISGTFSMGMGETADQARPSPCPRAVSSLFLRARRTMSSSTKRRSYKSAPSVHGDSPTSTRLTIRGRNPCSAAPSVGTSGRPSVDSGRPRTTHWYRRSAPWEPRPAIVARSSAHARRSSVCPACLSVLALTFAGVTSTGGLTLLVVRKLRGQSGAANVDPKLTPMEVEL